MSDCEQISLPVVCFETGRDWAQWDEKIAQSWPKQSISGLFKKLNKINSYLVKIDKSNKASLFVGMRWAVFSFEPVEALENIHAVAVKSENPFLAKLVKNDKEIDKNFEANRREGQPENSRPERVRKSFMTPTPLHIPGSRVAPIPGSAHEMVMVQPISGSEGLRVIKGKDILWLHPLLCVLPGDPDQKPEFM